MRCYKKYCYESKNYNECVKMTAACASEKNCDYLIDECAGVFIGYLLKGEQKMRKRFDSGVYAQVTLKNEIDLKWND